MAVNAVSKHRCELTETLQLSVCQHRYDTTKTLYIYQSACLMGIRASCVLRTNRQVKGLLMDHSGGK